MGGRGQSYTRKSKKQRNNTTNTKQETKHHEYTRYDDEKIASVQQRTGMNYDNAAKTVDAIREWTTSQYGKIRAIQHGKHPSGLTKNEAKQYKNTANSLETFIDRAPKWAGGTMYRGISVDTQTLEKYTQVGTIYSEKALASFTTSETNAQSFSIKHDSYRPHRVVFKTTNKATKHGASITRETRIPDEYEVLMSSKAKFRIKRATKKRDAEGVYVQIDITEI